MKTIVYLGSNKSGTSRNALIAATEIGFYTVLITDRKKFLTQKDEFTEVNEMIYVEQMLDEERILSEIKMLQDRGMQICACISVIDPFVSFAARISALLGLVQLSADALQKMEDKTTVREMLKDLSVSPFYTLFQHEEPIPHYVEKHIEKLPLILKSPVSNGSKDVLFVDTARKLKTGLKLLAKKYPGHPVLIEEYVTGTQYLIEILVYQDQISIVAVIEQEISAGKRFIVNGYIYPADLKNEEYFSLEKVVHQIIHQMKLSNGTCHLEMRKMGTEWKLIEVNPRVSGGAMNQIILEGTGINYVKEIIHLYLGEKPNLEQSTTKHVYVRFLTVNSTGRLLKVTGKNHAAKMDGIKEVYIKPRKGAILTEPYSLGDRYAYVISISDNAEEAREIALTAAKNIKFYLEPL